MKPTVPLVLFLVIPPISAPGQSPRLLLDINRRPIPNPSSDPKGNTTFSYKPDKNLRFPTAGNYAFFSAKDKDHGEELWKYDLRTGKATLVKDIRPGPASSDPKFLTSLGNKLLFFADDSTHGIEPWITDGTPSGTFLLADCTPGTYGATYFYTAVMKARAFWTSSNGYGSGNAIWATDGTREGTKKIFSGLSKHWRNPVVLGDRILFEGDTSGHGSEVWITDGTKSGTKILFEVRPGPQSGGFLAPFVLGGKCFFFCVPQTYSLYVTDGTESGTRMIKDGFRTYWSSPVVFKGKIFFSGWTRKDGREPWVTDGTTAGTRILFNIHSGSSGGGFSDPVAFHSRLYFQADKPEYNGYCLWVTDGTPGGTKVLTRKTKYFSFPRILGDKVLFAGASSSSSNDHGKELWVTDGTEKGTFEIKDINAGKSGSAPFFPTVTPGGTLLFSADDGFHGRELWESDGTAAGTRLAADIYGGKIATDPSHAYDFLGVCGTTYFLAKDPVHGFALWKTDGTAGGTAVVRETNSVVFGNPDLSQSSMFYWRNPGARVATSLGGTLFFSAASGAGTQIWKTDGTPSGTRMVKKINPGFYRKAYYHGCVMGSSLYFFAYDGLDFGLWKTDGTEKGTVLVKGGFDAPWEYPFPFREKIYFRGSTKQNGAEPWVTDGTESGTFLLSEILPGPSSGGFYDPAAVKGKVFFRAHPQGGSGFCLWETDGTKNGTKVFFSSKYGSFGYNLTAMGDRLFFQGWESKKGSEPWVSDGTVQGTRMLKDIYSGYGDGGFQEPCVCGGLLFFRSESTDHGIELWRTDGTPEGTLLVKDIYPGRNNGRPGKLCAVGSRRIFFMANDGTHGYEPWISDGTPSGTRLVADIWPGYSGSVPSYVHFSGGKVFFQADDGTHGKEPWVWFPGASARPFGFGTTDCYSLRASDPVPGKTMSLSISGMKWGQAGLFLLAHPTTRPVPFGGGWFYFDTRVIYTAAFLAPAGGASISLTIPNEPSLTGEPVTSQAFVFPSARAPYWFDIVNPLLLVPGK